MGRLGRTGRRGLDLLLSGLVLGWGVSIHAAQQMQMPAAPESPLSETAVATVPSAPRRAFTTGVDVYREACETCHGPDGTGSPRATVGFAVPLPDFTDCRFATAEPDPDWQAVVHEGGPIRGLDRHMPAFGDALTPAEIALAIDYVRTFCVEPAWPRGDLNLPRAFFTEKAFPENEVVWVTTFSTRGEGAVIQDLLYERRFGARNQIEVNMPIAFQHQAAGGWRRGLGDMAIAFKRTLHADAPAGRIASAGLEVILPTGKETQGLGSGDTIAEPFVMFGQILPRNAFVQMQAGAELPVTSNNSVREFYARGALGMTIAQDRGFGRAWSPQIEVLWARPEGGASEWDVVPQAQVTLSKLQHVIVAAGVRIPITQREQRSMQGLVYLLWDWFDGGFLEFWK
jgi:mono/diheme cytochrome c family protein